MAIVPIAACACQSRFGKYQNHEIHPESKYQLMIANLQLLRGIAALLVVFVHLQVILRPLGIAPDAFAFLHGGVDIFFVISGFIMIYVTDQRPTTAKGFLADRVLRIVPVYWLFTAMMFVAAWALPMLGGWRPGLAELVQSFLFIPFGEPPLFSPLLYVGWSLNLEMYFYVLFAITIALTASVARRILLLFAMLCLPVIASRWLPTDNPATLYGNPMVFEFVLGMLIAHYRARLVRIPAAVALAMAAFASLALVIDPLRGWMPGTFHRFAIPAAMLVIAAIALEARNLRAGHAGVKALGAMSYSLYLTHPMVLSVFNNIQERVPLLQTPAGALVLMTMGLAACLIFSWLVWRFFEVPVSKRLHARNRASPFAASQVS